MILSFEEKKFQGFIRNVLKTFWPKILTTNTLGANVHRMYECDKNQVPYCNVKSFKK